MGYCTRVDRRTGRELLVCDRCGQTGGVRRRRCPFGYCYPPAFCRECHLREKWGHKATHRKHGCEEKHLAFAAKQQREAELVAAGVPVRRSALRADTPQQPDRVHVLFQTGDEMIGRYMPREVYHAHPLGATVTLADYEATHGAPLPEAPPEFDFGGATKRVH